MNWLSGTGFRTKAGFRSGAVAMIWKKGGAALLGKKGPAVRVSVCAFALGWDRWDGCLEKYGSGLLAWDHA